METEKMKALVYDANMELYRKKLIIYTWGNVSMIDRKQGIVVIKPRGVPYETLEAEDMSVTDLNGTMMEEGLLPSVDLDIHLELYRNFPKINAIAHTHSVYAASWAQARRDVPVYGTTHGDHFYGAIPCTRGLTEHETEEDYEKHTGMVIAEEFRRRKLDPMEVFGVLAAGHGPFTWGETAAEAVENSVILEELSKMACLTEQINPHAPELESYLLKKHFFRKHGTNAYFYQVKTEKTGDLA